MSIAPVAADDAFVVAEGEALAGDLGLDNGAGADLDPDGTLLGWVSAGFDPVGDGESYLGASFSGEVLGFLHIRQSGYVTYPVWLTVSVLATEAGGRVVLSTDGSFTYTPPEGFAGTDRFDYGLVDGDFNLAVATATIEVAPTGALLGTAGDESLVGGAAGDAILALLGADEVRGAGGADSLSGGLGDDRLWGQSGGDRLSGGDGRDRLCGGGGDDRLEGGEGLDRLVGGAGADRFVLAGPGEGRDRIVDLDAGDLLVLEGTAFGLDAGALPEDWLAGEGAAAVGHARLILDADGLRLRLDGDGDAATANRTLAVFDAPVSLTIEDFAVA